MQLDGLLFYLGYESFLNSAGLTQNSQNINIMKSFL